MIREGLLGGPSLCVFVFRKGGAGFRGWPRLNSEERLGRVVVLRRYL